MKMTKQHFDHMAEKIGSLDTPATRARYLSQSNSLRGYQWHLVRHAGLLPFICDTLYQYLNDDHIQTALNRIVPTLDVEVAA